MAYGPAAYAALATTGKRLDPSMMDPRFVVEASGSGAGQMLGITEADRTAAMAKLAKQSPDPFDIMVKESTMAMIRRQKQTGRRATFHTGPRGLEGPMASLIAGGGTSLMGS